MIYQIEIGLVFQYSLFFSLRIGLSLKVGSCPISDKSVQLSFCPFLCSIATYLFSESIPAEKTARFC